jgi:hypothetical protein
VLVAIGFALGSLAAGATAWSRPSADTISACKDARGYLYLAPTPSRCSDVVTWNQEGPAGPVGPPGPAGPVGPANPSAHALGPDALLRLSKSSTGTTYKDIGGWKRQRQYVLYCPRGYDALGGGFGTDWLNVYGGKVVASEPYAKGDRSGWRLRFVGTPNVAPKLHVLQTIVCARRSNG